MNTNNNYDVIIVGAGPAGLSFACSLLVLNLKVLLVEKSTLPSIANPKPDGRETALTHNSLKILQSCLLYTSPSPRDRQKSRMPSSA